MSRYKYELLIKKKIQNLKKSYRKKKNETIILFIKMYILEFETINEQKLKFLYHTGD